MPKANPRLFFPRLTEKDIRGQLRTLRQKLEDRGTLSVRPNKNGIYAASISQEPDAPSGYQYAWLRDNAMIAFSRWHCGDAASAYETLIGLATFLRTQIWKMVKVIDDPELRKDIQHRPHVRFKADSLGEIDQAWPHAQNDALAYVAWLRFRLAMSDQRFDLSKSERELYDLFPPYFHAIKYWEDPDSGAWEETLEVHSSSVGAVVAALLEFQKLKHRSNERFSEKEQMQLRKSIECGLRTLRNQLPFEAPPSRLADAALLFLLYPLELIGPSAPIADAGIRNWILSLVRARLVGRVGVKRYVGDSYYCQDYDSWFPPEMRSGDFSSRVELRNELLQPGCEAQWCLFDPLLSVILGKEGHWADQINFLSRSVAQITADGWCPELYYLRDGKYVPNEHIPLAWTQANVAVALHEVDLGLRFASRR